MTPPARIGQHAARATAIGAVAIVLWSALALFTTETAGLPPFEVLGLSFAVGFAGSLALLASGGRARLARLRQPLPVWAVGFGGIFGYHASTSARSRPPRQRRPA